MIKVEFYLFVLTQELKEKKAVAPSDLTRPLEHHTLENLSYVAAKSYHKKGETVRDEARAASRI